MSYEEFFHLKDAPFRLTPDPDYFFPSGVHKEALDTLVFSINAGEGFILITGTPGSGKTLLVRTLLRELGSKVNLALVLSPTLSPRELLWAILSDLNVFEMEESGKLPMEKLLRMFRDHLLEKAALGIKTIIIIDEAQNLPKETLEELRMLSNLESDKAKLLQIILVGQLELEERLKYHEMTQLAQRISIRYRLQPLSAEETGAYVRHRLEVAGGSTNVNFPPNVMGRIHALSKGIPRRINLICERALMAAYVDGEKSVSRKHLFRAINSIEGNKDRISMFPVWFWPALGGALIVLAALWFVLDYKPGVVLRKDISRAPVVQIEKSAPQTPAPAAQIEKSAPQTPVPVAGTDFAAGAAGTDLAGTDLKSVPKVSSPPEPNVSTSHASPFPPFPLLPVNEFYLAVDRSRNMARLWQGAESGPVVKHEFQLDWRLMEGLYILGNDKGRGSFIFNPLLFQWGGYNLLTAAALWGQVSNHVTDGLVPVIVYSSNKTDNDISGGDIPAIRESIKAWSQAWQDRDVSRLMSFYGDSFDSYAIDSDQPQTYSLSELSEIRGRLLAISSHISLNTSDPVCLIDPLNPEMAIAVFRQEYRSSTYRDKGIKVLYLRKDGASPERPWKIVAKFFLPEE